MCFAEQECHLRESQVNTPHHLDQDPGFKVRGKGTASCEMTLQECKDALLALDPKAVSVQSISDAKLPKHCFRKQKAAYRFKDSESSYEWYFNDANDGQSESKSEPVCKGNAELCCLWPFRHFI